MKIRGIPPGTGKPELCAFFSVSPSISASLPHVVVLTDDVLRPDNDMHRKDFSTAEYSACFQVVTMATEDVLRPGHMYRTELCPWYGSTAMICVLRYG